MRTVFLIGLIISLCSCGQKDKDSTNNQYADAMIHINDSMDLKRYGDSVESFLNATLFRTGFNGSILVAKNGSIVYEKYIGYKDFRTKDSLDSNTPLQISSTSKPFTGAAILKLVQEGKLSLNDTLNALFPGFPYPGVTVKMLLNHRSGLPNYLYYLEKGGWDKSRLLTNTDVLQTLINLKPQRLGAPGKGFQYNNTNYVLLALIVEKVSGLSFPDYLKINFFDPLNMTNTYVVTVSDSLQRPLSFYPSGKLWHPDYTDGPYGDKNIVSTPRDLLKWDQSFYYHTFLNQSLLDSAFTPYSNERPSQHNYGLGWRLLMMENGKKVIYHNGHWHGFMSAFARLTDEKATIIILGNKFNRSIYITARKMYNIFGNYDKKGLLAEVELSPGWENSPKQEKSPKSEAGSPKKSP